MTDEWAAKKGRELALAARAIENTGDFSYDLDQIAADITVALNTALGKYVAAHSAAYEDGRQSVLARLENPDEALVEAVADEAFPHADTTVARIRSSRALKALARELKGNS